MNNVLGDIAFHTKALTNGQTASAINGGLLRGNSTMRDLSGQLVNAATVGATATSAGGTTTNVNATQAGFSVQRDGTVTFDASAFSALYAKDPAQAAAVVQKFADTVQSIGKLASDPVSGSVTGYVNGGQTTAKTMTDSIADWDDRLAQKQKRLESQYAALEVALGKLSDQGNSLTAALKQFDTSN
jgi:flagellar hook-associated protein 2